MTFSFQTFNRMTLIIFSRMTSKFYSNYNSSTYFIFKKLSNFSNLSKFVFFASIFSYQRIFLIDNWSYQYFIIKKMKNVDLFMIENTRFDKRQIVDCKLCYFIVFVNKWQYIDFFEIHYNACSNCSCVQNYKKKLKNKIFAIETNCIIKKHYYRALIRFDKKQKKIVKSNKHALQNNKSKKYVSSNKFALQNNTKKFV